MKTHCRRRNQEDLRNRPREKGAKMRNKINQQQKVAVVSDLPVTAGGGYGRRDLPLDAVEGNSLLWQGRVRVVMVMVTATVVKRMSQAENPGAAGVSAGVGDAASSSIAWCR
ncbi:hypothetical protein E3N88_41925 [Mikania micrantha]|uniref:Uncharacterized protein n=1 Tax=Mikania micrantha TaxID=192012 RepID=A0A5N6LJ84_9ASTR|nr:hypothetical protein E3N88_41925 [Mikania micrantha]